MTFSMFVVILGMIVLSVAFFHSTQGFFSAAISAILCVFAAVLSVSYHEIIAEKYLMGGQLTDYAHGATVLLLFAVIYLPLRYVFDSLVPGNVRLPAAADKAGSILMGLVAGVFMAGLAAFAAQSLPMAPAVMGYSRFQYEAERDANIPQAEGKRTLTRYVRDGVNTDLPLHLADGERTMAMLPADDVLMQTVYRLSERGALSPFGGRSVAEVHPDWLTELFGQRLGIQSAAKRVAINKSDGSQVDVIAARDASHPDAGAYLIDRPLRQRTHEFKSVITKKHDEPIPKKGDPRITIVLRTYFGAKAKDTKEGFIRFSPSSARLVARKKNPGTGELEWTNYYPLGTVDDAAELYYNRPDDFLFIDDAVEAPGAQGRGVDLLFQVEREGFLTGAAAGADPTTGKIAPGVFLEVKRAGRVDLSGQEIAPQAKLKKNPAIAVMRKPLIKNGAVEPGSAPAAPAAGASEGPSAAPPAAAKLAGSWDTVIGGGTSSFTFTPSNVEYVRRGLAGNVAINGTWKATGGSGTTVTIHVDGQDAGEKKVSEDYKIEFTGDDQIAVSGGTVGETPVTYRRKGGPGGESPTPPAPAAAKPAAPAAPAKTDTSLAVTDLAENPKFYAPIRVPAGGGGEVGVGGGTVTVDANQLKTISLPPVTPAALNNGQGEPINRLAVPEGSFLVQAEANPSPDAGGWAWKDRVGQIFAVDKAGGRHPVVGVWALVNNGNEVVARYTSDPAGGVSLADFMPAGPPTKVYLAFAVPTGQQVKQIVIGDALLKAFEPPVP
ncbi:MAG: hypothetical protein JWO31_1126 [Phycisphaerales bacterium]|nr:hypothetical protein [Phycisphaerales bacterium]